MVRLRRFGAALALVLVALAAAAGVASAGSLYSGPGPRPGPDLLYRPVATAPQLTNAGVWRAPSTLVSGTTAYRDGEFLYQDFLYDDHGANGHVRDPRDPRVPNDSFSEPNGTYTYPSAPGYAGNAADLVELRVKPLAGATALRLTLNTLHDPALVGFTVAIGSAPAPLPVPFGANATAPARLFLTVHGTTATLQDALTGAPVSPAPSVTVDLRRRQFEVRVPHAAWDPGRATVRLAAGVGLWDRANDRYLIPQGSADATHPGGAGDLPAPTAFFNVAFRRTNGSCAACEPKPHPSDVLGTAVNPAWWRDAAQGQGLARGDLGAFAADVDFAKLAAGTDDASGVPTTGPLDRILASHFETEQGANYATTCQSSSSCKGELRGRLQPYAIYVPAHHASRGYGLTLLLHSLGANFNQYLSTRNQSQFAERAAGAGASGATARAAAAGSGAPGAIVITPEGRGPDGWYYDYAGADTWEVWADVAKRYRLDPAFTDIAGYSMGGYGTYKLATQFPDLFARAQPTVGPPGLGIWLPPAPPQPGGERSNTFRQLASLRNIPFLMWVETTDELVPYPGTQQQARGFDALGLRYEFDAFQQGDHLTLAVNDQYAPAAKFLGTQRVDRNPAHVSYVYNPTMDFSSLGTASGHAYWLSRVRLRDGGGDAPLGRVDVRSEGFGVGDPPVGPTRLGAGALTGGTLPAITYSSQSRSWGAAPRRPVADRLVIRASNVRAITIDAARARVDCAARLQISSDGPLAVTLVGCPRSRPAASRSCRVNASGGRTSARCPRARPRTSHRPRFTG